MGRRKGLGAGEFATVDHSLMRGSSRMTTGSSQGYLALSASVGQKPLLDEARGSPDLRPAPRLMRRRDVGCWRTGRWNVLRQQGLALPGRWAPEGGRGPRRRLGPHSRPWHSSGHRLPSLYRGSSIAPHPVLALDL